ncbi:MAG TPA: PHP domain-containing protein, partial [Micropepsaceae bacterium]|nr:PHP domain-containing protein [Micropepsaceae bacterium]
MAKLNAGEIASLLREIGDRMDFAGENHFRARAYRRAADNLALTTVPVDQLIAEDRLTDIPGIGDALAGLIARLHETGSDPRLDKMRAEIPGEVLEMLRIPGLRPDRIRKLHDKLGIGSVKELELAARSDRLKTAKGFGPAFQTKILQGIELSRRSSGRHMHRAAAALEYTAAELRKTRPELSIVTPAGEFRRGCELVRELSLVAVTSRDRARDTQLSGAEGMTVYITTRARYGIALLLATGSEKHIAALRELAAARGWTLDPKGLRDGKRILASATEAEVYARLGLPFIVPELRETGAEVELAQQGRLPDLVDARDIHGVLHAHTEQSDGVDTLQDMAEAAKARGYSYLGLTDHSQTASYAGGLQPDEVLAQQHDVDRLNRKLGAGFRVFKGIESDILADGTLDYPDDILRRFDLIIASVHSRFRMSPAEQTARIVRAIENPRTTILGHVTGRQLLRRPGYEVEMEAILRACAKHGVAIEINANPWRLDIDWRWCSRALELGCMFSINPDAHSTEEIDNIR